MSSRRSALGVRLLLVLAILAGLGMPALRWFHESGHQRARAGATVIGGQALLDTPGDHHDEATCMLCQSFAGLRGDAIEPAGAEAVRSRCERLQPWSHCDAESVAFIRIQQVPARGPPSTG